MSETFTRQLTGAEALRAARAVLARTAPDDPMAEYVAALVRIMREDMRDPVCSLCGKAPRYRYTWKKLPRAAEPDLWLCEEHNDRAEERDEWTDFGRFYVKKATGAKTRIDDPDIWD